MADRHASGEITSAVDPVALVVTECITVTSAMRKHARWAKSSVSAILGGGAAPSPISPRNRAPTKEAENVKGRPRTASQAATTDVVLATRWGLRGKQGQSLQDNPLLTAFAKLRSDLKRCKDIHEIDAPSIMHPFLQVIRSSSTSAPITSLALIAVTKFLAYNIISKKSPQLALGMQRLSAAVTHCRFEASDSATDEVVLFRILKLMEVMIIGPTGDVIGDESMCEMMETGISMCCQVRLSELLRRAAEVSMVTMCQKIFSQLRLIEVEPELTPRRRGSSRIDIEEVKMDPSIDGDLLASKNGTSDTSTPVQQSLDIPRDKGGGSETTTLNGTIQPEPPAENEGSDDIKPYSLPSIKELFRVLVDLLDPHEKQHNDTMRIMALRIVDVALETAGPSIASHPSIANLAQDTLCRHLFQLVRSENLSILNESLRVAGTLLSTCRRVLKLQQELFLSYLVACLHPRVEIPQEPGIDPSLYDGIPQIPRLARANQTQPGRGPPTPVPVRDRQRLGLEGGTRKPDAREAMVENIGTLVRLPSFMAELFVNYDCEIDRSDMCVDMVGLLARNAFPDAAQWSTVNVPPLCLDALLGYVQSMAERLEDEPSSDGLPDPKVLKSQRDHKRVIIKGATKFNESPKGGIAYLAAQGVIKNPDDPKSVANFLKGTSRIDKKVLGDFLSKKGNESLLSAFMDLFDFVDLRVDEALRQLLNSFRLPGEAPLIDRIVNEFSGKYCANSQPTEVANKEALYVLTYAIVMLNTDQHNPNVKNQNRMSVNDFSKNLRGVNDGKDFDPEFLQEIYDSIRTHEIILPEEHDNRNAFDHAWKELQFKIQSVSDLAICDTNLFDAEMFAATWKPVVATLSYVFMSATDDTVFQRVVAGFDQCAQIAAKYNIHEALDHIVYCLSTISTLAAEDLPSTHLNTEVEAAEKKIMVSETAVRFGRDFKAQLATIVLFRVVIGHEKAIREGWTPIVRIILNLWVNSLIVEPYSVISSNTDIPSIPLQSPAQVIERSEKANEGGLFSAFTSYVSSFANDEPPEPSDQEVEYTLCTVDCVASCSFDQLFSNISELPLDSLKTFVTTLLAHLPEASSPQIITVKPDIPAPTPVRPGGQKPRQIGVKYDSSLVFVLELSTILSARDIHAIELCGSETAGALQSIVRDATSMHPVTLSRAVYYLLSFLRASNEHDFVRVPVVLHSIAKFDDDLFKQTGLFIVKGMQLCLDGPNSLSKEMAASPDFWSILHSTYTIPDLSQAVFDMVEKVVDGPSAALNADNYNLLVSLLNDFATAGSASAIAERRQEEALRRNSRQPAVKPKKPTKPDETVLRGTKALQIVFSLTNRLPTFISRSQLDPPEAWTSYWSPIMRTLTTHSLNPSRPIRQQSIASLQRVLLSPSLASETGESRPQIIVLFTEVAFPLMRQLLKPEVYSSDPTGMGETRLQAALLCCKLYLRFLDTLLAPLTPEEEAEQQATAAPAAPPDPAPSPLTPGEAEQEPFPAKQEDSSDKNVAEKNGNEKSTAAEKSDTQQVRRVLDGVGVWSRILEMMERLVKSGGQAHEALEEAEHSIRNVVSVMDNSGHLVPPWADRAVERTSVLQKRLWEVTWRRLERFVPGLMAEVFPPPPPEEDPKEDKVKEKVEDTVEEKASEEKEGERRKDVVETEQAPKEDTA